MKNMISVIILCMPVLILNAQNDEKGVEWSTNLSWDQVKQMAKKENKFIFVDAFATWCGPCKAMDMQVYTNDTVGNYFNEKFVSVKVQMDKATRDNDYVKSWYTDAENIRNQYKVESYPTYIFLSPDGTIVHKDNGFKKPEDLIAIAKSALTPGKTYNDPYTEFDKLMSEYKQGTKNYERMPYMVRTALKLQEGELAIQLIKDHLNNYVMKMPKSVRYTKENILMWTSVSLGGKTKVFQFFLKDGKEIDKVMKERGFSQKIVDRTIKEEIVNPFLENQNKNTSVPMTGMIVTRKGQNADYAEANWEILEKQIRKQYNSRYTNRNLLAAKIEWYNRLKNYKKYTESALEYLDKYHSLQIEEDLYKVNFFAWDAFMHSTDKRIIDGFTKWMEKVVKRKTDDPSLMDTYAQLLHKAGNTTDAIVWEQKAINASTGMFATQKKSFEKTLSKIKNTEPTYGAVWGYK